MNNSDIVNESSNIYRLVDKGQFKCAFDALRRRISNWGLMEQLDRQEETYKYMMHYMFEGSEDPNRKRLYDSIKNQLYILADASEREELAKDAPSEYFSKLRFLKMHPKNIVAVIDQYENIESDSEEYLKQRENIAADIFMTIWLAFSLNQDENIRIGNFLNSPNVDMEVKALVIAALALGLMKYFDEGKFTLLLKIYLATHDDMIAARAIVSAILVSFIHYRRIEMSASILDILETIADDSERMKDAISVIENLIRTQDTERINTKMQEEVIPEIMKLRPEIMDRFRQDSKDSDLSSIFEENPEWQELVEKSGLADKLKELTDMQLEGGDVMMMAFSNLKGFPFFNQIQNWFLPFSAQRSELGGLSKNNDSPALANILSMNGIMCDSDKYSFVLAINSMPEQQKKMMLSQMNSHLEQLTEDRDTSLNKSLVANRSMYIASYVKDIYRFFKIYKNRNDYADVFAKPFKLLILPVWGGKIADTKNLGVFAEFYFSRGYYKQAIPLFERIISNNQADESTYQKLAYAYQSEKNIQKALENYHKAEIINPDSVWLIKKLAICNKLTGNYDEAIKYYERIIALEPDNMKVVINLGHCHLESNDIKSALQCYYKADYYDSSSSKTWRPIAWCEFLSKHYKQSRNYYEKLIATSGSSQDYMNMGHLSFSEKKLSEALHLYQLSLKSYKGDFNDFIKDFEKDRNILISHGVDPLEIDIMSDRLSYDIPN